MLMVLPRRKKKKYAALVVNEDPRTGQVSLHKETKGLDMVRRDWCPLSKRTGARVLDFLLSGDQADVVVANVHKVLEDVGKEAREGRVSVADYVVTRGLNKPVEKYPTPRPSPTCASPRPCSRRVARSTWATTSPTSSVWMSTGTSLVDGVQRRLRSRRSRDGARHPDHHRRPTRRSLVERGQAHGPSRSRRPRPPRQWTSGPHGKEGAPAVVTPGGPTPKPKVDVEWYLAQQILPPIARLCEPIAGMSKASIADRLGLDARKFEQHMARSQQALAEAEGRTAAFVPMAVQSDEQRFGDCAPVFVECASCGVTNR